MQLNAELNALFSLIDDPDEEIFHLISKRIVTYGRDIIPCLEDLCETTIDNKVQNRIEEIIRQVQFDNLISEVQLWIAENTHDLLTGSHLVASYSYPHLSLENLRQQFNELKRDIWLEMNKYLTTLETTTLVSDILFQIQKIQLERINYNHMEKFCLHSLLEDKKGNAISNGILYQHLCESLDIPVGFISIPDQHILACYPRDVIPSEISKVPSSDILFYIDAASGNLLSRVDLIRYFLDYNIPKKDDYFKPLSHQKIIATMASEVGKCYLAKRDLDRKQDLDKIASLLNKD